MLGKELEEIKLHNIRNGFAKCTEFGDQEGTFCIIPNQLLSGNSEQTLHRHLSRANYGVVVADKTTDIKLKFLPFRNYSFINGGHWNEGLGEECEITVTEAQEMVPCI